MNFLKRKIFVFCIFSTSLLLCLLASFLNCNPAHAMPGEKIGVLYSYQNVESYQTANIVSFNQAWKSFLETFEETYLDSQYLCNFSPETKVADIGLDIILFPLAIDISLDEANFLNEFLHSGGKLLVTTGIGPISLNLKNFLSQNGIEVSENKVAKENLTLLHKKDNLSFDLPSGSFYSVFNVKNDRRRIIANWKQNNQIVIGGDKKSYLSWIWLGAGY